MPFHDCNQLLTLPALSGEGFSIAQERFCYTVRWPTRNGRKQAMLTLVLSQSGASDCPLSAASIGAV